MNNEKRMMVPVVNAIITNDENQILIVKRSMSSRYGKGLWQIPGGRMEFDETQLQALKREIKEELGCEFIPSSERVLSAGSYVIEVEGVKVQLIGMLYKGKIKGTITLQKEEISEYKWVSIQDALKMSDFEPATLSLIKDSIDILF